MRKTGVASLISLFAFGCMVFAQHRAAASNNLFMVGATKAEIRSHFGPPTLIFSAAAQRYYSATEERSVRAVGGQVHDVYERRSGGNAFRIEVRYIPDGSVSRLHPVERVTDLHFTPDRAAPFRTLLKQIPEAVALCKGGCSLTGVTGVDGLEVRACREPKYPNEAAIMKGAANDWGESIEGHDAAWKYCATVEFKQRPDFSGRSTAQPKWDDLSVDEVVLGANRELRDDQTILDGDDTGYDLGTWTPSPAATN